MAKPGKGTIMVFRHLREGDIESFANHCSNVFGDVPPEWFHDHWLYDPDRNPEAMFIAEKDGQIISTAQVFAREMYIKGTPVAIGAIGDVTTLKEYRRQGISTHLMRMCIDFMVNSNIPVSMLYTDIHDFYSNMGWFTVPRRFVKVDMTNADRLPDGYELLPFSDNDLKEAEELYHLSAGRYDGAFARTNPKYWSDWVAYYLLRPQALKKNGQMVAWIDIKYCPQIVLTDPVDTGDYLYLCDYATVPGEDLFLQMLAEYSRKTGGPASAIIPSPLLPNHYGSFCNEDRKTMFRLNMPFKLGKQKIDSAGKLAQVLSNTLLWQTDVY